MSGAQYELGAGRHRAVVVEVGGGVRTYEHDGRPVLSGYPPDAMCPRCAGGVLAPWPNRLDGGRYVHDGEAHQLPLSEPDLGNAIHGLVRWVRWSATEVHPDRVTLCHDLPPRPGYPFPLRLRTRWSVGPGGLRAEHSATNLGSERAPFGLGAHPYLDIGAAPLDQVRMQVPAARRLVVDERFLPVADAPVRETPYDLRRGRRLGALRLNTAYTALRRAADGTARVRVSVGSGRSVCGAEVWMDESFDWVQVFTAENLDGQPDAVAIEPMTCAPDGFNSGQGLVTLEPGRRWCGTWGVRPLVG